MATLRIHGTRRYKHRYRPDIGEDTLTSDWDNRWRTGGLEGEVIEEAHLDPKSIFAGVDRFAREREQRIASQRELLG
jgi:transketolase